MKKFSAILLSVLLLLLSACGREPNVQYLIGESELYTEEELREIMQAAEACFAENFEGCTLKELSYDEEFSLLSASEWAERYEAQEAVVLTSCFDTDSAGGDGSLNAGTTYEDWQWILVRPAGETWTVKTWGYG